MRVVDRLPPIVRPWVYRLWAVGRDRFGFDTNIELEPLPVGRWDIRFVEVTRSGVSLVDTEFMLEMDRPA